MYRRVRYAALTIVGLVLLTACVALTDPVKAAKTPEQKAFAIYGEFVVFEEAGAKIVKDPSTPVAVVQTIRTADSKAKLVMDSTFNAALEVVAIEQQLAAGSTTQDKLVTATANLQSWVDQGTPLVNDLVKAVKGVKTNGS